MEGRSGADVQIFSSLRSGALILKYVALSQAGLDGSVVPSRISRALKNGAETR